MLDFLSWLLNEDRQPLIPLEVLNSYEGEFKRALEKLIHRTEDPVLRRKFVEMLDCPVTDSRGQCRSFTEYIVSTLVRNGVHTRYDAEAVFQYVFEKMMLDKTPTGRKKATLFGDFDETRPYTTGFNPLQARFMTFLSWAIGNVRKGKIPRLALAQQAHGTVGLNDRGSLQNKSNEADFADLVNDVTALLRRKELAYPLPLVNIFQSMLKGSRGEELRQEFGEYQTRVARQLISQVLKDYAEKTGNFHLTNLLQRQTVLATKRTPRTPRPTPGKSTDFASIINLLDRLGRPAGSADFGKYRRRWLEYPPRDPITGYRNRLEEVLSQMTEEGVLKATRTAKGAMVYEPGQNADAYRGGAA